MGQGMRTAELRDWMERAQYAGEAVKDSRWQYRSVCLGKHLHAKEPGCLTNDDGRW